jgi:hypothetical protein
LNTIDKIKAAREVLKRSRFKFKNIDVTYNEDDTFSMTCGGIVGEVKIDRESMIAIADWVLCLFDDHGE